MLASGVCFRACACVRAAPGAADTLPMGRPRLASAAAVAFPPSPISPVSSSDSTLLIGIGFSRSLATTAAALALSFGHVTDGK